MLVNKYSVSVLVSTKPTIHLEKDSAATGKKNAWAMPQIEGKKQFIFWVLWKKLWVSQCVTGTEVRIKNTLSNEIGFAAERAGDKHSFT